MSRTIIFSSIISLALLLGQNTLKTDFDMCSSPNKKEFEIYKQMWKMLWEAPTGKEWEEAVVDHIAKKYSITGEHVDKINIKIQYYNLIQDYRTGKLVEDMTWPEFELIIRKYGSPYPKDCK